MKNILCFIMAYPWKELMFYAVQPGLLIFPVHYFSFLSWKQKHGLLLFEYKVDSSLNGIIPVS